MGKQVCWLSDNLKPELLPYPSKEILLIRKKSQQCYSFHLPLLSWCTNHGTRVTPRPCSKGLHCKYHPEQPQRQTKGRKLIHQIHNNNNSNNNKGPFLWLVKPLHSLCLSCGFYFNHAWTLGERQRPAFPRGE